MIVDKDRWYLLIRSSCSQTYAHIILYGNIANINCKGPLSVGENCGWSSYKWEIIGGKMW